MPPPVERQVAEIAAEPDRAAAYARLLHLQRGCADDPSAAADLAAASPATILPLLVRDAAADDEAVAASALKCLGFALYHPVLVSTISGQTGQLVLDTLVQLIMATRMKAICNLGIWCISVQQLGALIIEDRVTPLLTAIVYALDNPFGSLSTTFEAVQATMKLACQNPERMKDLSSIWAPPMYRRLLSTDKTERDMVERCLTKLSSVILPSHPLLSKAVASDLEKKLLNQMMNLLGDPLKKVQVIKSWGWFISFLGSSTVNARPLLNKILKVPEKMFIDPDPQVQIAAIGVWRNLVDALFAPHVSETMDQENMISPTESRAHANAQLKKIRLIMMPICRVLSRSHNVALNFSCFRTWHYLLCKLGDLINHRSILEAAFGPVLKILFSMGPDNVNKPLWSFCINLFHDFISARFRHMSSHGEYSCVPLNQNLLSEFSVHLNDLLHIQYIKWSPWDTTSFDFQLEILGSIVNPELHQDMTLEMALAVIDSATQIFRLLLRGIQADCVANFNVQICITKACQFVKKVFLDLAGKQNGDSCAVLMQFGLQFVEVTVEELDHSLLASRKYEIFLDIEHIKEMQHAECSPKIPYPGMKSLPFMEMVSPAVYMIALSLSMVTQFRGELSQENAEKLAAIFCLPDLVENFHAAVAFLYMQIMHPVDNRLRFKWLIVWNKIAKLLNKNDQIISHYQFLCFPFFAFLSSGRISTLVSAQNSSESNLPVTQYLEVELATEVYKSLCTNLDCASEAHKVLLECFFEYLVSVIDENMPLFQAKLEYYSEKNLKNIVILCVLGEVVIVLLDNIQILSYANQELKEASDVCPGCREPNLLLCCLKLVNRFMRLSHFCFKANIAEQHQVTNRVFSSLSTFVGHLISKKGILLLLEIIGDQLNEWLSLSGTLYSEMQQGETIDHLEKLWLTIVSCLKISQLISDGSFLQKQRSLLQSAVNHSHHPISVATTSLWRALRSDDTSFQHPGCLVSKLDELTMDRRKDLDGCSDADRAIALQKLDISWNFALPALEKRTITSNSSENSGRNGESVKISVGLGRKRLKTMKYSTNKPKELGKNMVSSQHVRSEVCRKPELILEMLVRKK